MARKDDIAIIESDVLGPMVTDRPPPIAAMAPERTLYLTSFTKITVKPVLAAIYPLSDFHRAQQAFMSKAFVGSIVVIPDRLYERPAPSAKTEKYALSSA